MYRAINGATPGYLSKKKDKDRGQTQCSAASSSYSTGIEKEKGNGNFWGHCNRALSPPLGRGSRLERTDGEPVGGKCTHTMSARSFLKFPPFPVAEAGDITS